jgi:hypothetical protein
LAFTSGSTQKNGNQVTLAEPIDFANSQGVEINHAGPPCVLHQIPCEKIKTAAPKITPHGETGSTRYDYRCEYVSPWKSLNDPGGGLTRAGTSAHITNGHAKLTEVNYNTVSCPRQAGAGAYLFWRSTDSGVSWTPLPVYHDSTFNDFGYYPPAYQSNGIPYWQSGGKEVQVPVWVPDRPNEITLADNYVGTILSGAGTKSLRVSPNTSSSVTESRAYIGRANVWHSDDQALFNANAAALNRAAKLPFLDLFFPYGKYVLFSPFTYNVTLHGVSGAEESWFNGITSEPGSSVIVSYAIGNALTAASGGLTGNYTNGYGVSSLIVLHMVRVGAALGAGGNFGGRVYDFILAGGQFGYCDYGWGSDTGAAFDSGVVTGIEEGISFINGPSPLCRTLLSRGATTPALKAEWLCAAE